MIAITSPADLVKLEKSIITSIQLLNDPARCVIQVEAPDEQWYTLTLAPNYQVNAGPLAVTITTGIQLGFAEVTNG